MISASGGLPATRMLPQWKSREQELAPRLVRNIVLSKSTEAMVWHKLFGNWLNLKALAQGKLNCPQVREAAGELGVQ